MVTDKFSIFDSSEDLVKSKQPLGMSLLLGTLLGSYIIQSTVGMFTFQGLPAILRAEGVSTVNISLLYVMMLPWVLKFLWAPKVERYRKKSVGFGNHCKLSLSGNFLLALSLLLMTLFPPQSAWEMMLACLFLMALIATVVDITNDGFAVDQLPQKNHSLGNVAQVGGSYLGAMVGGGLFIYVADSYGWRFGLSIMAAAVVLMALPALLLRNRKNETQDPVLNVHNSDSKAPSPSIKGAWENPSIRNALFIVCVSQIGTRLVLSMMMPFMIDQKIQLSEIGLLAAGGGAPAALVGVLIGGFLVQKKGAFPSLIIALVAELFCFAAFVLLVADLYVFGDIKIPLLTLFVIFSMATATKFVALYTLMMNRAKGTQSGVDFTLLQSFDVLIAIIAAVTAGFLIAEWGHLANFFIAFIFTILALLMLMTSPFKSHESVT